MRAGVGKLTLIDGDVVDPTNKNRQLQALNSTVGQSKVTLLKNRYFDINPEIEISGYEQFMMPEDMDELLHTNRFDYILDCIDSVQPKVTLLKMQENINKRLFQRWGLVENSTRQKSGFQTFL